MDNTEKYININDLLECEYPYQKAALDLFPKLYATCKDVEMAKGLTLEIISWSCSVPNLSHVTIDPVKW
ncbi:hypothetical protein F0316_18305 [Vibrio cholerae]|uniref:hypothetical protein n=1 Tax=Vibrio cholerae TaxID=666 RepID=UPI0011F30874|nr:hypothetical protein [Vibrio cholerae]QEO43526.1 hypothetical protein F0316_18305 [Vibrio cholerae]